MDKLLDVITFAAILGGGYYAYNAYTNLDDSGGGDSKGGSTKPDPDPPKPDPGGGGCEYCFLRTGGNALQRSNCKSWRHKTWYQWKLVNC